MRQLTLVGIAANRPLKFELSDDLVLGRSAECSAPIADSALSKLHCRLQPTPDRTAIAVLDLGSTNGTYINGQRVTSGLMRRSDRLTVGTTTLRFAHDDDDDDVDGLTDDDIAEMLSRPAADDSVDGIQPPAAARYSTTSTIAVQSPSFVVEPAKAKPALALEIPAYGATAVKDFSATLREIEAADAAKTLAAKGSRKRPIRRPEGSSGAPATGDEPNFGFRLKALAVVVLLAMSYGAWSVWPEGTPRPNPNIKVKALSPQESTRVFGD